MVVRSVTAYGAQAIEGFADIDRVVAHQRRTKVSTRPFTPTTDRLFTSIAISLEAFVFRTDDGQLDDLVAKRMPCCSKIWTGAEECESQKRQRALA